MKNQRLSNINDAGFKYFWKRRPSEIRGYHRTLYLTLESGDYLRVDYNLKEKRVRLYVEAASEGGNPYYSVISNGKITAERSVSSGRSYGFADKFESRAEHFSSIGNKDVLRLINRNYGITQSTADTGLRIQNKKLRDETKKRYFNSSDSTVNPYYGTTRGSEKISSNIMLVDFFDFFIGILLAGIMFIYFQFSFMALGITSAFYGIIIGFIDMFVRDRAPVFVKVISFLIAGIFTYIYGYFLS